MKFESRSFNGDQKIPSTKIIQTLNDQLIICIRSWNSQDANQKIADEITHYLSSLDADLDITTPFDFIENLSFLANKVRVAVLLANDLIYGTDNKEIYQQGAEIAIFLTKGKELIWSCVGRFSIQAEEDSSQFISIYDSGVFLNDRVVMPQELLGLYKSPQIQVGSMTTDKLQQLHVESKYNYGKTEWTLKLTDFKN